MWRYEAETIHIDGLRVDCVVGIHPHEREREQPLLISLSFPADFAAAAASEAVSDTVDYSALARETGAFVRAGRFRLLETLVRALGRHLCTTFRLPRIALHVRKPEAIAEADSAALSLIVIHTEQAQEDAT